MAISNKFGAMVVTTGNKSEMSVGYATIYGDMNGGFNPIKDLYKMEVYRLSALRNRWKPKGALGPDGIVIPENILTKAPTAELRENQKDQDSLPPYEDLDDILRGLVEQELRVSEIVAKGYDLETVKKVERLLYHRRIQAPPVGARREGDAQEFRPRPPLPDRQPLPRSGPGDPPEGRGPGARHRQAAHRGAGRVRRRPNVILPLAGDASRSVGDGGRITLVQFRRHDAGVHPSASAARDRDRRARSSAALSKQPDTPCASLRPSP